MSKSLSDSGALLSAKSRTPRAASLCAASDSASFNFDSTQNRFVGHGQPLKGYMQPTASYLAKKRSRKVRSSARKNSNSHRPSSPASGGWTRNDKSTETPVSIGGTIDSAWDMISSSPNHIPVSSNVVETWLNDCEADNKNVVDKPGRINYQKPYSGPDWGVIAEINGSKRIDENRKPETPYVEFQKCQIKKGILGHICTFLLGAGVVTLFNTLSP